MISISCNALTLWYDFNPMFILNRFIFSVSLVFALTVAAPFTGAQAQTAVPRLDSSCLQILSKPVVVIVDGYSSAQYLAPKLREMGYKVVHVHGAGKPPSEKLADTFHPEHYDLDIRHTGNRKKTLALLRKLNPVAIIPGAESGVLFADDFAAALHSEFGVPSNGVLNARREKYEQGELLREAGIPVAKQLKSRSWEEILAWVHREKLLETYPHKVVIKPLQSSGSDGVSICRTLEELRVGFEKIFMKPNHHGVMNTHVLAQEYLDGPEFVVNTVSDLGRHIVTDIWLYEKKEIAGGGTIYKHDRLQPFEGAEQAQLVPYIYRVLNALKIRTGWGHAEIKMTPNGPRIIEIGARMMGSGQPILVRDALGVSQIELGLQAFLHPGSLALYPQGYGLKNEAVLISLTTEREGLRMSVAAEDEIRKLPGYVRHSFYYPNGARLPRTMDMDTIVGQVELVHPDPTVLEDSLRQVHLMEYDGRLYR